MHRKVLFIACLMGCSLMGRRALAQWTDQVIPLVPGWNAVHLQVEPFPRSCDELFAGLPIESVRMWNPRFNPVQFIQDPATLVPESANWLTYLPPSHPRADQTTLFRVLGGQCYLIQLANTASPTNWVVLGRPVSPRTEWITDSFNLAGFSVDAQSSPTFRDFFEPSPAHSGATFYRLRTDGHWEQVPLPNLTLMQNGQAYWLECQGRSTYQGPLEIGVEQAGGLDFGHVLEEQTLVLRNTGIDAKSMSIRQLPSAPPPPGAPFPSQAGDVPLSYWLSSESMPGIWTNLPATLIRNNVAPGAEWRLRLAVRRKDMSAPPTAVDGLEPRYESLIEVTESAGSSRHLIPVSAYGLQRFRNTALARAGLGRNDDSDEILHAGLWVGSVVVGGVNQPASVGDSDIPRTTASKFQFRIILHVDASGQVRLLQKVLQMWKRGTSKPDPDDPSREIVDVPGRFVLLTDETLAASYSGATLRDGEPVGRRISTAAFSFRQPLIMASADDFGSEGSTFVCTNILDYQDPLNPFVHRYHPDHDNLNESYTSLLAPGTEAPTVTRMISLEFTADDPDRLQIAGWGSSQLGGIYRETVQGLHKAPLYVEGTFRIHLSSDIPTLNDQAY